MLVKFKAPKSTPMIFDLSNSAFIDLEDARDCYVNETGCEVEKIETVTLDFDFTDAFCISEWAKHA